MMRPRLREGYSNDNEARSSLLQQCCCTEIFGEKFDKEGFMSSNGAPSPALYRNRSLSLQAIADLCIRVFIILIVSFDCRLLTMATQTESQIKHHPDDWSTTSNHHYHVERTVRPVVVELVKWVCSSLLQFTSYIWESSRDKCLTLNHSHRC